MNDKISEDQKCLNTWLVDKEIDDIMRRYQKIKAPYKMSKIERVLNILPKIDYKIKSLILTLKSDKDLLIDSTDELLRILKKDTNVDDELINKYSDMMY
tara:strand:+ start:407 stop:703 length:297 start_codon:yes stop_codon:yes gene_type:complete